MKNLVIFFLVFSCQTIKENKRTKGEAKAPPSVESQKASEDSNGNAGTTSSTTPAVEVNPQNSTVLKCDGLSCDPKVQYCLISTTPNGKVVVTNECVKLPEQCLDCKCTQSDAKKQFPTSNNCSGIISCNNDNGSLTVTCIVPKI